MSRWAPETAYDRVMKRTHPDGACLVFDGHKIGGYGVVRDGDKTRKAHRVVYEHEVGAILNDLTVDHMCCRTDCVQTSHMQLVTLGENSSLGHERLGAGRARRTLCAHCGADFQPRARASTSGRQWCSRSCHTAWRRSHEGRTTYSHRCTICDNEFESIKREARTCGRSCRGRYAAASKKGLGHMTTDRGTGDRLSDRTLGLKGSEHLVGDDGVPMDPEQLGERRPFTLGPHPFDRFDDGNVYT